MRRLPLLALLLGCLAAGDSLAAAASPATAAARHATHVVVIEAMQFAPATLEVHAGDTVVWQNKDPFPHNVRSADRVLSSPDIGSGAIWKFKARKKGTYEYVCTLHPGMKGTLVVK